jgi:hypothetical protein
MTPTSTVAPVRRTFRALVRAVAPAAGSLDEAGWLRAEAIVDEALAGRPASIRRQIVLFLRVVNGLAVVRHGRSFARLPGDRAQRLLRALECSRLLILRRGLWGVRTLAYMGYYAQDAVQRDVGYAAAPEGWGAVGGDAGPWPDRDAAGVPEPTTLTVEDGGRHA